MTWLLAALLSVSVPNLALTPGAVRPLSKAQICQIKWGTDRRHVTTRMKQQVAAWYGLAWADRGTVEFDHLIPRNLGGADDVRNLFPMCCRVNGRIVGPAHEKDVLEVRVGKLLCAGKMSLKAAQALFPARYRVGVVQ